MKISCPKCPAVYELDESRIPVAGLSIKCPKCATPFTVAKPKAGAGGAVPLPSAGGAKAPGAAPPRPSAANKSSPGVPRGAVPLPGTQAAARPPGSGPTLAPPPGGLAPGRPSGAVPLPGQPGARTSGIAPPPAAGKLGAVPLPGQARAGENDPFGDLDLNETVAPRPAGSVPLPGLGAKQAGGQDPFAVDLSAESAVQPKPPPRSPVALPALLPDDGGLSFDFIDQPARPAGASATGPELLDFVDEPPPTQRGSRDADDALMPKAEDTAVTPARPETHLMPKAAATAVEPKRAGSRPPPPVIAPGAPPVMTPGASSPRGRGVPMADESFELPSPAPSVAGRSGEPISEKIASGAASVKNSLGDAAGWVGRNKRVLFGAVLALVLVVGAGLGVRAGSTDAGYFWIHKINPRVVASGAGRKAIDVAQDKLAEGTFLSTRGALGTAAQVMQGAPDDDDVRAFFIMAAAELKFMYGQGGVDWDLAQRTIDKLKSEGPRQVRARAAFALAQGDALKAKTLLGALVQRGAAETQGIFLYAQALHRLKDDKGAAEALDVAIKGNKEPPGKLLLARALVAKSLKQLPEAAQFLTATLERQPGNARAMIEMADVKRTQDDLAGAMVLLDRALLPEQQKTLDASEEARAMLLRGAILATQRQHAQAEAAFERAVELDANSVEVRGTYGAWRAMRHEYEKALRHLEVALGKDPSNPDLIDPAVRSLLVMGKPLDASKRVAEGLKRQPDHATLLFLSGKVEEGFGKPLDAMKNYEAALKKQPDHAEALVAAGFILLNTNEDKDGARKRLEAAEASPDGKKNQRVQLAIGDLRLALGDGEGARQHYAKALEMAPDDAQAHASMGRALLRLGELPNARHELETAQKTLDADANLLYDYGSLLRRVGDRAAAQPALEKAVKLAPNDFRVHARLGALHFEQGDLANAEKELRQAALLSKKWSETYFYLGRTFAAQRKLQEAVEQLKKAIEIDPQYAEFHYELGTVFEQTRQIGEAVKEFTAALDRDPKLARAHEHIAKNYLAQNIYEDAIVHFAKAAEIEPQRIDLVAARADAEHQAGKMDDAIEHYKQALNRNPKLSALWSRLGVAYKDKACNDCRKLAVQAFLRAEETDPREAAARRELGYIYKEDGKRAQAIAELSRYIELRPEAADADQVRDDIYYLREERKRVPGK